MRTSKQNVFITNFLVFIILLIACTQSIQAQKLTLQQEIWLYRIVQKTPVLKSNWASFFSFDQQPFTKDHFGNIYIDFDAIAFYQEHNHQSLIIDYLSIKKSSQGLIAEAAIKLTLWELNEQLKDCFYREEFFNDSLFNQLRSTIEPLISHRFSNKKKMQLYSSLMHPSLPIFKKIEHLDRLKIDVKTQEKLLNKWSETVTNYSYQRSQHYFSILSNGKKLENTTFLAAGEGSGTAGLLYEWEINPQDSTKRWYGKGIGLFTYQTRTHKDKLTLRPHVSKQMSIPAGKPMALHTSLWGLDSSFKPMLIVTNDTVSYHLFAISDTKNLSPNRQLSSGISPIERIEQHRRLNIEKPMQKIKSNKLLSNTYEGKQLIYDQIKQLENEIDTLKKYEPNNTEAIDYRKRSINTKLTSLSKKEQRIKELEQAASKQYRAIDNAEKKLKDMIKLLGPSPQPWTKEGNIYTYADGVRFNSQTQDLVFPPFARDRKLEIRLLSAGYSLGGTKKDEVQAYVSITDTNETQKEINIINKINIDTTFIIHFSPDEFKKPININWSENNLSTLKAFTNIRFEVGTLNMPDSLKSTEIKYFNRIREYQQPLTSNARNRIVKLQFVTQNDTLIIRSLAYADLVPTRLSRAPKTLRKSLAVTSYSTTNNKYLIALRAFNSLIYALKSINVPPSRIKVDKLYHNLEIKDEELQLIIEERKEN